MTGTSVRLHALQATMVRLTVDADFGRTLYADEPGVRTVDVAGGPYVLTDEDLTWFRAVDPRAWTTDVYRSTRLVQAIVEEYAVSTAILGVPVVRGFLQTTAFAALLGHRGSMAEGFGVWAASQCDGAAREVVRLETTIVRARRDHRPEGPGFVTVRGKEGVSLREGTLEQWQQGLGALGGSPVEAAAKGVRWSVPELGRGQEHWLLERNADGGLGVHALSAAAVGVLEFCRHPRSRTEVSRQARALRVGKKNVGPLLRQLEDDGLLENRTAG
jgi:hypothetical protein